MRYDALEGVRHRRRWPFVIAAMLFMIGGAYILLLVMAPFLMAADTQSVEKVEKIVKSTTPGNLGDRLFIPRLGVDLAIVTGKDESVLDKGVWHRKPEHGDPVKGGNFILSAHRFELGLTPQQTRQKSPFYHIDRMKVGDEIYEDYQRKRYLYTVQRLYDVERTAIQIEAPSKEAKLTLYSCSLKGEQAGRVVVEAKPATKEPTAL